MVTGALPACRTDPSDSAGLRNHHDSIPKFGRLIVSRHTDFGPSSYLQPCSRQVHLASSFEHLVEKIDQVNLAIFFKDCRESHAPHAVGAGDRKLLPLQKGGDTRNQIATRREPRSLPL